MNVTINGKQHEFDEGTTLAAALERTRVARTGVAVAVDGSVVPRASWERTSLGPGAAVEVLTAVQGG